ncbi:MAG: AmmeMemoRadiSam system protein B [Chloroflexi bacterium RBG_16_70_13]|nr:MAG: AmmeMemoRadiSam system protein B [Chloroflexi bacterium RBG_16_70_13]
MTGNDAAARGALGLVRHAAVAGEFYPAPPERLRTMVRELLDEVRWLPGDAMRPAPGLPAGLLVPHAGLVYSGVIAAAAWSQLDGRRGGAERVRRPMTVVILGTNHRAGWLEGVAAAGCIAWRTPLGDVPVDAELGDAIVELGSPFGVDAQAHDGEHSIEVQLPLLQEIAPDARIVPLAVSAGIGHAAIEAGRRLGEVLAGRRAAGDPVILAISSDMAHYPSDDASDEVTEALLPSIRDVDPAGLAAREIAIRGARIPGLVCGMCGVQPAVMGLAALRTMGATTGVRIAASTSADADGPRDRTVGYLSVAFWP